MNNDKPVGFNGISSLVSTIEIDTCVMKESVVEKPVLQPEPVAKMPEAEQPTQLTQNNQEEPSSHFRLGWKFGLTVIFFVFVIFFNLQDNTSNSKYSPASKVTSKQESNETMQKSSTSSSSNSRMTFTMPQPGTNRVLGLSELRWCLREEIMLKIYQTELNKNNSSDYVIDKFNLFVSRYNARCGSYKYYQDKLSRATREINALKNDIEQKALRDFNALAKGNIAHDLNKYDVLDVQNALKIRGYDVGIVDGVMGKRTRNAIKAFQRDNNLVVDGAITITLMNRLQIR
ncbi:peptidoglycan-binding domain-containing protein [Vibrio mediterranei]|jgi:hypothetical protein|uniref:peptidoglycan-binding domain-containing protein n=1 Tax=Vibrio mediterranei TaxID=689 RepID=UPI0022834504|nr:peptidoglycan-binding domain-containing protein [Vibrio mediterranei]MCY9855718.1 peptidoglycan-binding domain-containing protein [Vibrio mediterranei]